MAGGTSLGDDDEGGINGINVTPLVDIMLVLLIIFMVASSYIVKEAIEVELPKAATGEEVLNSTIALIIKADGRLFLDGEPTTKAAIKARCEALVAAAREKTARGEKDDPQAMIAADKGTSHGAVVSMIDWVRQNGVTSFAINIDPSQEEVPIPSADEPGDVPSEGTEAPAPASEG